MTEDVSTTTAAAPPAPLSPLHGFFLLLIVVGAIVAWTMLGQVIGVTSFFASFLFLWYWGAVEHADMKQWPQSLAGALVGLGLAWACVALPKIFQTPGVIALIILLVVAIYVQLMNWLPMAVNRSCMLFLTVLGAPALLEKLDVFETALAIGIGAIFFAAVVKLAAMVAERMAAGKAG